MVTFSSTHHTVGMLTSVKITATLVRSESNQLPKLKWELRVLFCFVLFYEILREKPKCDVCLHKALANANSVTMILK